MSWSRAASRTTGRSAATASTDRSVWSHRSSPAILFWGIPRWAARSGEIGASRPVSLSSRSPTDGSGAPSSLLELGRDPLAGQVGRPARPVPGSRPASPASTPNPSVADSRTARIIRSASSSNRARGSPTARRTRARASAEPVVRVDEPGRLARSGAPGHRVDGEVAAGQVELDGVAELDVVRSPEVGVVVVGAEGRDVERRPVAPDADRAERVLVDRPGHELHDPLGQGVRGEIPVVRRPTEHDVAQRPADDVGRLSVRPERLEQGADGRRDRAVDGVRPTGRGRQLRPRNRYERHASLRSSPRYGVNSE